MSCVMPTKTNKENSILLENIYKILEDTNLPEAKREALAKKEYAFFTDVSEDSTIFKIFGDYVSAFKDKYEGEEYADIARRVDDNGEPSLYFDKKLKKHYFIDKYGERVLFPRGRTGLNRVFSNQQIKTLVKSIAFTFYKENLGLNIDDFSLINKENSEKLSEYIKKYLQRVGDNLLKSSKLRDKIKGKSLIFSVEQSPEWLQKTKDYYNSLKLELSEKEEFRIEEQEESFRGELVRVSSMLKSSKTNINNDIKLYLSLFKNVERNKNGKLQPILNEFGEPTFVPFDDIFSTLNKSLANNVATLDEFGIEDEYEIYLEKIKELSNIKPYFELLHKDLRDKEDEFKNKFIAAFRLHRNNYLGSEAIMVTDRKTKEKSIEYIVRNLSEVGSRKSNILLQWYYNFQNTGLNTPKLANKFKGRPEEYATKEMAKIKTKPSAKKAVNLLRSELADMGVNTTVSGFNYFINELNPSKELTVAETKAKLYKVYYAISKALEAARKKPDDNLFLTQSIFKEIAEAETFFMEEMSDASIFTMNKTKWVYSNPSHLSLKIAQWKRNPNMLLQHYKANQSVYTANSQYMPYLLDLNEEGEINNIEIAKERLAKLELFVFNSIQEEGDSLNAVDNKDASYRDSLVDYVNKLLGDKPIHKTALAADNSTEYQLSFGIPNTSANIVVKNGEIVGISSDAMDILFGYFMDEYNRTRKVAQDIENGEELIPNYHIGQANGLKFQLFPELNGHEDIFDTDGTPFDSLTNEAIANIKIHIKNKFIERVESTSENLIQAKVFEINKDNKLINRNVDKNIYENYAVYGQNSHLAISADLLLNNIMSQVEYVKMFTGDMAYYKNHIDFEKRAKATYTDGLYMRLQKGEEFFNVAVIEGVEVPEPSLQYMQEYLPKSIWEKYQNVNTTDAQAWITPARWEFIIRRIGKWSKHHDSIIKKMKKKTPRYTQAELKLLAQPLKGVYFDVVEGRPAFLKYSQAVLIPNLIKDNGLKVIHDQMVKNDIDELVTRDGIKVGYPIPDISHKVNGNVDANFKITKSIKLSNSAWKLQQDLPVKGFKQTDIGTQIQKNIFQGLAFHVGKEDVKFDLFGGQMPAEGMIDLLNAVTQSLGNKGLISVVKQLGIDDDGKIRNESALYSSIIEQLLQRKDTPDNIINALRARTSPYAIPGALDLFQNVFSKIVNDKIVKLQTNGGGFIQMADYGITRAEIENSTGIIKAPWFNEKYDRLHPPVMEDGKLIPGGIFISGTLLAKYIPNYRDYTPEQIFGSKTKKGLISKEILQSVIGYRIPNQGLPSNDALQVLGILPEGVADTVIAYAGITKKTGSDFDIDKMYLMLPSYEVKGEGLMKKGFDYLFDNDITPQKVVDELQRLGFEVDLEKDSIENLQRMFIRNVLINDFGVNNQYHEDFHENYVNENVTLEYIKPDLNKPLHEQSKEELQNILIEIYKSVLLNTANIEDIMNPLDDPIIENDIKNLNPDMELQDFEAFDAFNSIDTKAKFRTAKQGLGQAVNYTMDFVRGAMGELTINDFQFYKDWGNLNEGNEIEFDKEYSEELTPTEIKDYIKSYNSRVLPHEQMEVAEFKRLGLHKIKLSKSLIAYSNAFVDVANNPFIIKGNWVTQTNNLGLMLIRAGVHPFKVNAFLNSPIIKDFVRYKASIESKSQLDRIKYPEQQFLIDRALPFMAEKVFTLNGKEIPGDLLFKNVFSEWEFNQLYNEKEIKKFEEGLRKRILIYSGLRGKKAKIEEENINKAVEFMVNTQIDLAVPGTVTENISFKDLRDLDKSPNPNYERAVFQSYLDWTIVAKTLSKGVGASRVDVDGKGKDIGSLVASINKINDILRKDGTRGNLTGFQSKMYKNERRTTLSVAMRNGLLFPYKIMRANPKYFLQAQDNVLSTFNLISQHIYGENLERERLTNKLQRDHYSYIMSGFAPLNMTEKEKVDLIVNMPEEFRKTKTRNKKNILLQELYLKEGLQKKFYIAMPNVKKPVSYQNDITDAWRDLLVKEPAFAERLIKYSFLASGFNNNLTQFHQFIPYEWLNENRVNSYIKSLEFTTIEADKKFIDFFFRNNTFDTSVVRNFSPNRMEAINKETNITTAFKDLYETEEGETPPYLVKVTIKNRNFIQPSTERFYKLIGLDKNNQAYYVRTTPLGRRDGKGNNLKEYSLGYKGTLASLESMYGENVLKDKTVSTETIENLEKTLLLEEVETSKSMVWKENTLTSLIEKMDIMNLGQDSIDFKKC